MDPHMAAVNQERSISDRSITLGDRVRTLAMCCHRAFPKELSGAISSYYKDLLVEEALEDMEQILKTDSIDIDEIRAESMMTYMRCFSSDRRVYQHWLSFCSVQVESIRRSDNPERWLELLVRGASNHIDDFDLYKQLISTLSSLFFQRILETHVWSPQLIARFLDLNGGGI